METEKLLVVILVSAMAIIGLSFAVAFITFEPTTTNPTQPGTSSISDNTDLIDLSLQAPNWDLVLADGSILPLSDLEGKFILVDLMATWCSSCVIQNSRLLEIYNNFDSEDLFVVSLTVDISETVAMIVEYQETKSLPWTHGLDPNQAFTNYFSVSSIPTMIIIDADGFFRWKHVGLWSVDDMTQTLALMMP
ncbi:MAG: TlpA disulfide reductase family protein [Candidatus Thorarchaeota archaeon]